MKLKLVYCVAISKYQIKLNAVEKPVNTGVFRVFEFLDFHR